MENIMIPGKNGYKIPCGYGATGREERAVLIMHGFGSSKDGFTAAMLTEELPKKGIAALAFDFPAHGKSPVDGDFFTLENCLADMASAEEALKRLVPKGKIGYFGSSFGAYMTLLYLASGKAGGKKAFLRSAAVEMPELLANRTAAGKKLLEQQGYIMEEEDGTQPLKLTQRLFDGLDANNVFEAYQPGTAELHMVHGTEDEAASFEAARRFADLKGAGFTILEGGDHQLSRPGMPEQVLALAVKFFKLGAAGTRWQ
ncbi:alpha/beta fold hydrolase [Clostridiales bacterium]|nr:alpha/beta fold hydrolase [Clostridiales bacterium]